MITEGTLLASRYRVGAVLGRGGMADVHLGTDEEDDVRVAVKILRHVEADQARRFASEATTLARMSHPAIVGYCDAGEHDGTPYLVMDYVEGPSLADVLREGPLGVERSSALGRHLAEALAHAHHLGIVHRDVKPGNVLLDAGGYPRLADFGIARLADATSLTVTGTTVGTASYLAPEQLEGRHVGPAADVYSLGLVLLECSTGRRAYDGTPTEAAMARLVRDPEIPDDLPGWWRDLLREMTTLGPDFRPSARDVQDRLAGATGEDADPTIELPRTAAVTRTMSVAAATPNPTLVIEQATVEPAPEPPASRRGPVHVPPKLLVAALALVVLAVVLFGWLASDDDGTATPTGPTPASSELDDALDRLEQAVNG